MTYSEIFNNLFARPLAENYFDDCIYSFHYFAKIFKRKTV